MWVWVWVCRTSIQISYDEFLSEPRRVKAETTASRRPTKKPAPVSYDFGPYAVPEIVRVKQIFDSFDTDLSGTVLLKEFMNCAAWRQSYASVSLVFCGTSRAVAWLASAVPDAT